MCDPLFLFYFHSPDFIPLGAPPILIKIIIICCLWLLLNEEKTGKGDGEAFDFYNTTTPISSPIFYACA